MSELINVFGKLSEFYPSSIVWEQVEDIYAKVEQDKAKKKPAEIDDDENQQPCTSKQARQRESRSPYENNEPSTSLLTCLPVVQQASSDSSMLSALLEVSTTIRAIRESGASYDNTFDCWDQVIKVSPRDGYLAFIYICVGLGNYDLKCRSYRKLSLAAASTYFLSLTIPGAKGFHIFQEDIISTALQVFSMIQNIQNPEIARSLSYQHSVEMWVNFTSFCDDLKLLFRYVGFEEYKGSRDAIVERLVDMQFSSYDKGFPNAYAANLHGKCFEIFDEVLSAHNGDPKETLLKILNMTLFLHTYPPKPKGNFPTCTQTDACEHISDWYIKMIDKFPRLVSETLEFYIKVIITNPERGWKSEHTQRAIEYAAKYDAALFTRCNASIVDFLSEAVYADEISIRSRSVDLLSKMILLESNVDWQMFRHEVSEIPREVYIIKELIDSIRDVNNNIKLKAVQAIHQALIRGSPNAKKILTEGLKFAHFNDTGVELPKEPRVDKNEIRFIKPNSIEPQYTFSGVEIVLLSFLHMPEQIYALFCNPVYLLRRAAIMLTEAIVKVNPLIIFNTNFVQAACSLVDESTALVRKQTLIMVDSILATYPNCYPVVYVWCKIIAPMFQDSDPKNIDLAMECFRTRVLLNIKGIDQSNEAEHFMPWVIIRTLLITTSRLYLQNCFHTSLKKQMIDQQIISTVESHIFAANSTEAWVLLNFICGKIKSKEPDSLIHCFVSYHSSAQWNNEQNLLIALEVLNTCISDFSHSALNYVFNHLLNFIQSGMIIPQVIDRAFDFLTTIENWSMENQAKSSSSPTTQSSDISPQDWLLNLHIELEEKLLEEMSNFPDNRSTYMSYLFSYSEANLHLKIRPHRKIILFIHTYMLECIKIDESELELDNDRIFNSMIVIAGRFSIREPLVAATTCNLYGSVLEAIDRPQIVNTILVAISDLCKKHTQLIEMILDQILRKLSSQYLSNRRETFNNFTELVLQDQLKLKGSLLLALLAVILDEDEELSRSAINFFDQFIKKKNPALFLKCLMECPFVLNGYSNFEGLDSFTENMIKSPLKGSEKRRARYKLYNHFMGTIDDINLILYFGNLKTIAEKTQTDPMINTPEGCDLIKDTLYILKSICQKERKDTQKDEEQNGNSADDTLNISEIQKNTHEQMDIDPPANVSDKPQGRKVRRRDMPTMSEALAALEKSIVFIVTIAKNTASFHISIQKSIDELAKALSIGFPNIIEFAQPVEFWSKYRKGKVTSTPKRKQSRVSEKDNEEDEGISEDEKMDTDSEHGEECVTPSKRLRNSSDVIDQMMLS